MFLDPGRPLTQYFFGHRKLSLERDILDSRPDIPDTRPSKLDWTVDILDAWLDNKLDLINTD